MILGAVPVLLRDTPERSPGHQPDFRPLCRGPGLARQQRGYQAADQPDIGHRRLADGHSAGWPSCPTATSAICPAAI